MENTLRLHPADIQAIANAVYDKLFNNSIVRPRNNNINVPIRYEVSEDGAIRAEWDDTPKPT